MEGGVNGLLLDDDNRVSHPSSKVDYHLNNLLASHLSNSDLTPQELAEASRSTAVAATIAAKEARATSDEKAAAAAKAVAAAKKALDLIASFPNQEKHVPAVEELPSKLQLRDVSQGIVPHTKNDQWKVRIGSGERANKEDVISKRVDKVNESGGGEGVKEVSRKRGRPKSK